MALHPLAFYKLDETSGTVVADSSGNGYNLTNTTPTKITLGVAGLTGDGGTAYKFTAGTSSVHGTGTTLSDTVTTTIVAFVNGDFESPGQEPIACFPYSKCLTMGGGRPGFVNEANAAVPKGVILPGVRLTGTHMVVLEMLGNGNCVGSVDGSALTVFGSHCGSDVVGPTANFQLGDDVYTTQGFTAWVGTYDDIAAFYGANAALTQTQVCQLASDAGVAVATCPTPTPPPSPNPTPAAGTVYVSDSKASTTVNPNNLQDIVSFAPGNLSGPPTTDITTLNTASYNAQGGITLDASGNLWMDNLTPSILEFAPNATGNATPTRSITPANATVQEYWGIAIDAAGEIYADGTAFPSYGNGQIDVYAANASGLSTPIRSFTGPEMAGARKLAIDGSGDVWAVGNTALVAYPGNASGTVSPIVNMLTASGTGGMTLNGCAVSWPVQPQSIAFDAQGNMLIATISTGNGGAILKFAPPFTSVSCPVAYLNTLNPATDVAVDNQGNLYTIGYGSKNQVDVYPESAMTPGYPSSWSSVTPVSPSSSIVGSSTNIFGPDSIAVKSTFTIPPTPTPAPYPAVIASASPSVYYPLNQALTAGTTLTDMSGNGNNSLIAGASGNTVAGPIAGLNQLAVQMTSTVNGDDEFNDQSFQATTNGMSFEEWVNTTTANEIDLFSADNPCQSDFDVRISPEEWGISAGGDVVLKIGGATPYVGVISNKAVNDGNWHYVAAVWNGTAGSVPATSQLHLYVDGVDVTGSTFTAGSMSVTAPVAMFSCSAGFISQIVNVPGPAAVDVSQFAAYNYALTPGQVLYHYQVGTGLIP